MTFTPTRCRDGRSRRGRMPGNGGGIMLDVLISLGITLILLGVCVTGLRQNFTNLPVAAQAVANDLRKARMYAITRGAHYRMTLASNWYKSERLQDNDNDGVWQIDTGYTSRQQDFKGGVTMVANTGNTTGSGSGTSSVVEFDTRGMVVPQAGSTVPSIMTVTINGNNAVNTMRGTLYVYVWPSGQVELLKSGEVHP